MLLLLLTGAETQGAATQDALPDTHGGGDVALGYTREVASSDREIKLGFRDVASANRDVAEPPIRIV